MTSQQPSLCNFMIANHASINYNLWSRITQAGTASKLDKNQPEACRRRPWHPFTGYQCQPGRLRESFVSLGSMLTHNGDLKREIDQRRALAWSVMRALRNSLWLQQAISRTTNLRIHTMQRFCLCCCLGLRPGLLPKISSPGFDSRAQINAECMTRPINRLICLLVDR